MTDWDNVKITVVYPIPPSPEYLAACAEWLALVEHVDLRHGCGSQCPFYAGSAIGVGSGAPVESQHLLPAPPQEQPDSLRRTAPHLRTGRPLAFLLALRPRLR